MIMVYYVTIGYMQFMKMNNDKTTIDNGQKVFGRFYFSLLFHIKTMNFQKIILKSIHVIFFFTFVFHCVQCCENSTSCKS